MDLLLGPYELGATQWYVLFHLSTRGPMMQRELVRALEVERATLSVVITTLVRKGLIEQLADKADQRQRLIRLTQAGVELWAALPDLTIIHRVAFDDIDDTDITTALRVLRTATERLEGFSLKRKLK